MKMQNKEQSDIKIVSKPGATVEVKVIPIPPRVQKEIDRAFRLGPDAARPERKTL